MIPNKSSRPAGLESLKQQRKKSSSAAKQAGRTTKSQNKSLFLAYGSPASSHASDQYLSSVPR